MCGQVRDGVTAPRADNRDVRFVLAVNKADLLPAQATAERLEVIHSHSQQASCQRASPSMTQDPQRLNISQQTFQEARQTLQP